MCRVVERIFAKSLTTSDNLTLLCNERSVISARICQVGGLENVRSTIAKESIYGQVTTTNFFGKLPQTFTSSWLRLSTYSLRIEQSSKSAYVINVATEHIPLPAQDLLALKRNPLHPFLPRSQISVAIYGGSCEDIFPIATICSRRSKPRQK